MAKLREAQGILLHCHAHDLIDYEEFILLDDVTNQLILNFPTGRIHLSILRNFLSMNVMQNLGILIAAYTT